MAILKPHVRLRLFFVQYTVGLLKGDEFWPSFLRGNLVNAIRDLYIRGRHLKVCYAYSQTIDTPESFILCPFLIYQKN